MERLQRVPWNYRDCGGTPSCGDSVRGQMKTHGPTGDLRPWRARPWRSAETEGAQPGPARATGHWAPGRPNPIQVETAPVARWLQREPGLDPSPRQGHGLTGKREGGLAIGLY